MNNTLDTVLNEIKKYLPQYIESQGVRINTKNAFKCINPDHKDTNPSCGIVPNTDNSVFHCFACNTTGNIFLAANFLEGAPLSGKGFISDNVIPLAQKFGIELPDFSSTLSEAQLKDLDIHRAYADAASIIRTSPLSEVVKEKLGELGWTSFTRQSIGIGGVESFDKYIATMQKTYGHNINLLREIDLDRKSLFHENNLIYVFKDEHGSPVGFAARRITYEKEMAAYKEEDEYKPKKYINTSDACPIFNKGTRLFNFSLAKKYAPPLYIFEGQPDAVTAYQAGIKNSCAIGSTAFTKNHLDLILKSGIKHIIFVLDPDEAGKKGTDRFVKMLEESVGGYSGLRVELIAMPPGTDDPDAYIRKFGYEKGKEAFRSLDVIDIFTWSLKAAIEAGKDPITAAQETIPYIVNEPNNITRMDMTTKLATATKLDERGLWREVLRLIDADTAKVEEEKSGIAKRVAKELERNPSNVYSILDIAKSQVEMVENSRLGYDPMSVFNAIKKTVERNSTIGANIRLSTGYPILDEALDGGLPSQVFVTMPGGPNHGKSTFLDNLVINLLSSNPNIVIFHHSLDDALSSRVARLQAARSGYRSKYFSNAGYFMENPPADCPHFAQVFSEAQSWLYNEVSSERLILVDRNGLAPSLLAFENWANTIRHKFPNKELVLIGDNFHLYELPGAEAKDEAGLRRMSAHCKGIANATFSRAIFTMEIPKEALRPGVRPRLGKIKGSGGMSFDSNLNLGVYNDIKSIGEHSELVWSDSKDLFTIEGPNGEEITSVRKKPILEIVVDKSKVSSFDGSIFFRFDPDSGCINECTRSEQEYYKERAYGDKKDAEKARGVDNKFFSQGI